MPPAYLLEDPSWFSGQSKKPWQEITSAGLGRPEPLKDNGQAPGNILIAKDLIAAYESKFHYRFWRPVTAIRAGDTDGNPRTEADPEWTPSAT